MQYRHYTTPKRLLFETLAYIACIVFAIGMAFMVEESDGVFTYCPFNIYIQPLYMIFVLVVAGYHIATSKKVAKAYNAEKVRRQEQKNFGDDYEKGN